VPEILTRNFNCAGGLPAFLALPASGGAKLPAIVLMHERYGLVRHTLDLAERFARDGFVCIAPDFYYRYPDQEALHRGDVGYPFKDTESNAHIATAIAELGKLQQVDPGKIVVMGVCQTGRHPLVYAAEHSIAAALVWYGAAGGREWETNERFPRPLDDLIAAINCPVLGIFGEADHVISLDDVRRLRNSLDRHDKTYTIKIYPAAPHGWLNDTMPGRYRHDIAEASWAYQLAFLKKVLDPNYDHSRRIQIYESEHAADYDFGKNVRLA